jgi:hypothetical protein
MGDVNMECTEVVTPENMKAAIALIVFAAIGMIKVGHWILDAWYFTYKALSK